MSDNPIAFSACTFYTNPTETGMFVGRCENFPDLRTRPQKSSLDALDEIMTVTRNRIARIAQNRDPQFLSARAQTRG